jgi:hypothetical protein
VVVAGAIVEGGVHLVSETASHVVVAAVLEELVLLDWVVAALARKLH